MSNTQEISRKELEKHYCFEKVDKITNDTLTTNFKQRARYQQSLWREKNNLPIGSQPIQIKIGKESRPLGSRINLQYAKNHLANFLTPYCCSCSCIW